MAENATAEYWDDATGLWARPGPGHTVATWESTVVHEIRRSARWLLERGMDGMLDRPETGRVLRGIRGCQTTEGEKRGCIRWYLEDNERTDQNSGFFTGLSLAALRLEFGAAMIPADLEVLDAILRDLVFWFDRQLIELHRDLRYPNRTLGDLVCRWLLAEAFDEMTPSLEQAMTDGGRYYLDQEWGWGEHMSDVYATVCKMELVALLVYGRRLPAAIRKLYEQQYDELMAIDHMFKGGPRVPTIRCYSFEESPSAMSGLHTPIDELIRPWKAGQGHSALWAMAHRNGFNRPPAARPPGETVSVVCHGGATAEAVVLDDVRAGAMSRYPIMAGIDHPKWGLAWQTFPFCFWHKRGDWGFMQWEAFEDGQLRAHPANILRHRTAHLLSAECEPPRLGQTLGHRRGRDLLAVRTMPRMSPHWPWLIDRLRLVAGSVTPSASRQGDWEVLSLNYPGQGGAPARRLRVAYRAISGSVATTLEPNKLGGWDWNMRYAWPQGQRPAPVAGMWLLQIDPASAALPAVDVRGPAVSVAWPAGSGQPGDRSIIDLSAASPQWTK